MNYKAVLFDLDGVIVDSEPLHVAAFQAALKHYGHDLTEEQYKQYFAGRTDEAGFTHYFDAIGERVDLPTIMAQKAKIYLELAADQLVPYPGVLEFIQSLAARKVPLALVTGSLRAEAAVTLKAFKLTELFAAIITAEDITHSKPNPEGYLKGAKALGVQPGDCIVIEDAPSGVAAANAAGMRCLAVTTTHTAEELQDATLVVDKLQPDCLATL
ncbi:MAG TPA: HAD family phosphatase [Candidatus Saccharimonadales bacterium]|nr:HAD family phosphatase [Candidatus Saccharimonadales bacterium]